MVAHMFKIPTINMELTGRNIKKLRQASGYTVSAIQEIMGFNSPQAIFKWQRGECLPTVDNLVILAVIFHISIDNILVLDEGDQDVVFYAYFCTCISILNYRFTYNINWPAL